MQGHRDLIVWQKAMDLVVAVYKLSESFPKTETYGLASQIQRAAVSIPSNIAEGHGLKQTQAYARHLAIASGSLAELETQLEIADRLGYLSPERRQVIDQASEVGRMLWGLRRSLQRIWDLGFRIKPQILSRGRKQDARLLNPESRILGWRCS
jgi:four helix bundle protein